MEKPHKLLVIKDNEWILPKGKPTGTTSTRSSFLRMFIAGPSSNTTSRYTEMHPSACVIRALCISAIVKPSTLPVKIQNAVTKRLHQIFE
jgi:hypothetical protein